LILDFEFDQHLESHKHVINIIMGFRDMGCYSDRPWHVSTALAGLAQRPQGLGRPNTVHGFRFLLKFI
jgi:hypothetical protein